MRDAIIGRSYLQAKFERLLDMEQLAGLASLHQQKRYREYELHIS